MTKVDKGKIFHANALRLGHFGILIIGASGSGKSLITLSLIERAALVQRTGILVADDYVLLQRENDSVFAHAPQPIRGGLEIRGAGLFAMPYQPQIRLDLIVELKGNGERFPNKAHIDCLNIKIPALKLPEVGKADALSICHAVEAHLFKPRWSPQS